MSKTKIKIDQSEAKAKIDAQIDKGRNLVEKALHIIRDTHTHTNQHTRAKDNFIVTFDQWRDFTIEIINQIFVSSTYAYEFKEKESSKSMLVNSHWSPDVDYYLEQLLIPKIDYLTILSDSIEQFQKEKPSRSQKNNKKRRDSTLEVPDRVTLAWLWRHVPYSFWFWFIGLLVSAFITGLYVGQLEFIQKLINQWK